MKKKVRRFLPRKRRASPDRAVKKKAQEVAQAKTLKNQARLLELAKKLKKKNSKKSTARKSPPAARTSNITNNQPTVEVVVVETSLATTASTTSDTGTRKKANNVSKEEDIALARAWRSASEDPVMGSNMKASIFQEQI
jgi:hypothetical protein